MRTVLRTWTRQDLEDWVLKMCKRQGLLRQVEAQGWPSEKRNNDLQRGSTGEQHFTRKKGDIQRAVPQIADANEPAQAEKTKHTRSIDVQDESEIAMNHVMRK